MIFSQLANILASRLHFHFHDNSEFWPRSPSTFPPVNTFLSVQNVGQHRTHQPIRISSPQATWFFQQDLQSFWNVLLNWYSWYRGCLSKTNSILFLPIVLLWSHFNDEISGRRLFWAQDFLNLLEALAASLSCPLWPPPPPGAQRPPDGGKEEEKKEEVKEVVEAEEEEKEEEIGEEEARYIYYSPNSLLSIHKLCQR